MSERKEKFERVISDIQNEYTAALCKLEKLKHKNKTKPETYKQLLGNKLMLQDLLVNIKYRDYWIDVQIYFLFI